MINFVKNSKCLVQAAKALSRIVIIAFLNIKSDYNVKKSGKIDILNALQKIGKNEMFESKNLKCEKSDGCVAQEIGVRLNRLFDLKNSVVLIRDRYVYTALGSFLFIVKINVF